MSKTNIRVKIWREEGLDRRLVFQVLNQRSKTIAAITPGIVRGMAVEVSRENYVVTRVHIQSESCPEIATGNGFLDVYLRGENAGNDLYISSVPVESVEEYDYYRNLILTSLEIWSSIVMDVEKFGRFGHKACAIYKEFPVTPDNTYEF